MQFRLALFSIADWLSILKPPLVRSKPSQKTHDFTQGDWGQDYIFESADGGEAGYLTGQGNEIRRGDYLILPNGFCTERYKIEEINYYSNPRDMWIALLKRVQVD